MFVSILPMFYFINGGWAAMCAENGVELSPNSNNNTNPLYVYPPTGETFHKYNTDVGSATESEINTVEYLSSYNVDKDGAMWLISEDGKAVARMTQLFVKYMAGGMDVSPTEHTYQHDGEAYHTLLAQIRGDPQLQDEAQTWVRQARWTPAKAAVS